MRNLVHAALIAGLVAATPATAAKLTPEEQLAKLTAGRTAGKPVNCIGQIQSTESQKIRGLAMAFRQGTTWYVNRFHGDCPSLSDDTIVVTKSTLSQMCRGDIVDLRTAYPPMPVGSCVFDSFTPYTLNKQ